MVSVDVSGIVGIPYRTFPTGWFQVAWSKELAPGEMREVTYWNRNWIVWRSHAGVPVVMSTECARRGEPLTVGKVLGEALICGVCGWSHRTDGSVLDRNGWPRPNASVRVLPTRDVNELIMAWYDAVGDPPQWEVPIFEEVSDPGFYPMYPHGAISDVMRVHPQMVAENVADAAHIHYIHKWLEVPTIDRWEENAYELINVYSGRIPTSKGPVATTIENHGYGLGLMTTRFWGLRDVWHFGAVTPIDPSHVVFRLSIWVGRAEGDHGSEPDPVAKAIFRAQHREVLGPDHDRPIWENQRYQAHAAFRKEERHYMSYRRWVKQFYPHDSDPRAEVMAG